MSGASECLVIRPIDVLIRASQLIFVSV